MGRKILQEDPRRWNNFLCLNAEILVHVVPTYRRIENVLKMAGEKNKLSVEVSQLLYNNCIIIVLTTCFVIG